MGPFFFGSSRRRLFGVYTPAAELDVSPAAVVLCQPWGTEYIHAHRAMVRLGETLSRTRFHVLRFDYYGSGDSGGDFGEVELEGWRSDIRTAADECLSMSGASRISLVGLRIGANLAADVARDLADLDALVAWDPIVDGAAYATDETPAPSRDPIGLRPRQLPVSSGPDIVRVVGSPLGGRLAAELKQVGLGPILRAATGRTLIVGSGDANRAALRRSLADRPGAPIDYKENDDAPAWLDGHPRYALPVSAIDAIRRWL